MKSIIRIFIAFVLAIFIAGINHVEAAQAKGNSLLCNINFHDYEITVEPTKGDFVIAGEGFDTVLRYATEGDKVWAKFYQSNSFGGRNTDNPYICYVYQAKNVGTASTIIIPTSGNSSCTNWDSWLQIQSAYPYSSCRLEGTNLILE